MARSVGGAVFGLACLAACHVARAIEYERNNWVVLVETSRYWYNYRHTSNVLTFYHTVKRLGIPDSQIIMMLAEDMPCNLRNSKPGTVFNEESHRVNLYGEDVEVDYRGDEVSIENFIRLLTGRHPPNTPRNKRLLTDSMSNVLIFITGHSGDEFIKFQDWEEMTSNDLADAFQQMHKQRRYQKLFWISDTCQASTLQNQFYSPEMIAIGSSGKDESSYAHGIDNNLGVAIIDRWTFYAMEFFDMLSTTSTQTIADFMKHKYFIKRFLASTPQLRSDLFSQRPNETKMTEFFASTGRMRFMSSVLPLQAAGGEAATAAPPPRLPEALRGVGCTSSSAVFPLTAAVLAFLPPAAADFILGLVAAARGRSSAAPSDSGTLLVWGGAAAPWLLGFVGVAGAVSATL